MTIQTNIHLNLRGDAREALAFYRTVFGGEVTVTTYDQVGLAPQAPDADKVVFGVLDTAAGARLMAYDIPGATGGGIAGAGETRRENGGTVTAQGFFVALSGDTLEEVDGFWQALSETATIIEPLAASPWSPGFGMLTDRFGVTWSVSVTAPTA